MVYLSVIPYHTCKNMRIYVPWALTELLFSLTPTKIPKDILKLAWGLFFKAYGRCLYRFYSCFHMTKPYPVTIPLGEALMLCLWILLSVPLFLFPNQSLWVQYLLMYLVLVIFSWVHETSLAQWASTICWRVWQKAEAVPGTTNYGYLFQVL